MPKELVRLALLQISIALYCIIGIGVILKVHYPDIPQPHFASWVRDHGYLFFLVTLIWCVWAIVQSSGASARKQIALMFSGAALCAVVGVIGVCATWSAFEYNIVDIQVIQSPTPAAAAK